MKGLLVQGLLMMTKEKWVKALYVPELQLIRPQGRNAFRSTICILAKSETGKASEACRRDGAESEKGGSDFGKVSKWTCFND